MRNEERTKMEKNGVNDKIATSLDKKKRKEIIRNEEKYKIRNHSTLYKIMLTDTEAESSGADICFHPSPHRLLLSSTFSPRSFSCEQINRYFHVLWFSKRK